MGEVSRPLIASPGLRLMEMSFTCNISFVLIGLLHPIYVTMRNIFYPLGYRVLNVVLSSHFYQD